MQYKPISLHYKQKHITMKKQMKQIALRMCQNDASSFSL